jgi:histidinol-phosphate aminotransferase
LVGVGSDEVISMLLRAFARESKGGSYVLTLTPTFVMYRLAARTQGHQVIEVPLDAAWNMNLESVLKAVEMCHPTLIFIASPNNPTGTMPDPAALARLCEHAADSLVVIDEAYIDYAARDHFALLRKYENVIILRTLSKVGFAALRLGWMMAAPEIVHEVNKVRLPFNMPTPTQAFAALALSELGDELQAIRAHVLGERTRVATRLSEMRGVTVTPSEANFLWLTCERPAEEVFEGLKARGVLVRSFHKSGGRLKQCVRVTIGLERENDFFLSALAEVL